MPHLRVDEPPDTKRTALLGIKINNHAKVAEMAETFIRGSGFQYVPLSGISKLLVE